MGAISTSRVRPARGPAGAALTLNESPSIRQLLRRYGTCPAPIAVADGKEEFDDWSEETRDVRGRDGHTGRGRSAPHPPRRRRRSRQPPTSPRLVADAIYHNGVIVTMDDAAPAAQAVALGGTKILAVGGGRRRPEIPRPVDEGRRPQRQDRRPRLHRRAFAPGRCTATSTTRRTGWTSQASTCSSSRCRARPNVPRRGTTRRASFRCDRRTT